MGASSLLIDLIISLGIRSINCQTYKLNATYAGNKFFDLFEFLPGSICEPDAYSNFVMNQSSARAMGIINTTDKTVYIGTDYTNTVGSEGRASICIGTKDRYQQGLFIMDSSHMPQGSFSA